MSRSVFISYRRDDAGYAAHMIRDHLVANIPGVQVFMDIDNIPLGVDFRAHLDGQVQKCDVMLAIVSDHWLGQSPTSTQRRIDSPTDFVRTEVESALRRRIPVVPVLVGRAGLPTSEELPDALREFAYRQAAEVRHGPHLKSQLDRLTQFLAAVSASSNDDLDVRLQAVTRVVKLRKEVAARGETTHIAFTASAQDYPELAKYISKGEIVVDVSPDAVSDFAIDEDHLSFEAFFGGRPLKVKIPTGHLRSVYASETGQGYNLNGYEHHKTG